MTAKRPSGETFEEAPHEKRGRLEGIDEDDIDAELDDEVEKELREFERLQSGLLDTSTEQGNGKTGGTNESQIVGKESEGEDQYKDVVMKGSHVGRESIEQDSADGSDMELDDLEQEIAEARKKNTTINKKIVNKASDRNKHPVLNETVSAEGIRISPDTFAEKNLLHDDLVEISGIVEEGEEACLDKEQVQLFKDSTTADQLFKQQETDSRLDSEKTSLPPDAQELLRSAQELLNSQCQNLETEDIDEDPNDPDFPSPGKRKSRAKTNRSKSRRSQQRQLSPEKCRADQELLTSKSPKKAPENHRTAAPSESEKIYPSLPGTSRTEIERSILEQFVPKEPFVDPVLKIPVQPKSLCKDPEFRDPIFDHVSKPKDHQIGKVSPGLLGSRKDSINDRVMRVEQTGEGNIPKKTPGLGEHHVRALDFDQTATRSNPIVQHTSPILSKNYDPEVINSQHSRPKSPVLVSPKQGEPCPTYPKPPKHPAYMDFLRNSKNSAYLAPGSEEQDNKRRAPSSGNPADDTRPTKETIDITYDQPAEYCVVERIIQRKFKNSFLLDDEKLDMIEDDRPEIWGPELFPYTTFYDNQKWLAACNELKRFFCWPCLFFSSKVIWSVTCDENSESMIGKEINKHEQSPVHQESIKQRDALMLKKESSIVTDLLDNNFVDGTWTDQMQEEIIMKGRPRPILDYRADQKTKKYEKSAYKEFYDKFQWICGCTNSNAFCCWPCLLFSREKWKYAGTIKSVEASLSLHEATQPHMDACFKLGKWEFDLRKKSEADDEGIEKTRTFLKCLVEIFCAEKKKINNVELSPLDFVDSLELMSRYNEKLRIFIDEKSKKSSIAQIVTQYTTAILDSVELFIKGSILEEIQSSNFVSLIFDHSSGLSNKAILSVIARYVDGKGLVHERFVKLLNVGYNTPSNMLTDEFFQIITELQCRSTLIGFTYDGYLVKPGNIPDFNAKVQKLCPNAKFFHYCEHNFKRVLKQTLSHVPVCRRVLQAVQELASFFESTPKAMKGLSDIISATEKSHLSGDQWKSSNFITTVFIYHAVIVEIMESVTKNAQDWRIKAVVQASNFLDFLKDSTNRFYVTLMARIFDAVEELSKEVARDVGVENLKTVASHVALKIQKLGRNFDSLVESACSHLEKSEQEDPRKEMETLREQFSNVVRLVVKLVKNRIFGLESSYFKITNEVPTSSFGHFIKLKHKNQVLHIFALPSNFSSTRLSKELQFFHESPVFSELDLSETIALMNKYNMTQVLPELYKFLQLAFTVPKKEYDGSTIPAVRRISAFIEGKKDINSIDALIWMEKEFISNLQKTTNFYEKITDRVMAITKKDSCIQSTK